ncbi:MAG: molybdenum ABC transporter periplasmic molybdate-binding protein [Halothiobacillaceae bacterium]|nr:MAG: molybdenum ABC transporter periplasmic molybdate-binding protein [Halothiobacillaceae bacterium]
MVNQVVAALVIGSLLLSSAVAAESLNVAVASNFSAAFAAIQRAFKKESDTELLPSYASTGKLYAQIVNGAPFALFLAADVATPAKLEQMGLAAPGRRFTYAIGHLVLWSAEPGRVDAQGEVLKQAKFKRLAIANPKSAPYGLAAQQALTRLGLWERLTAKLVQGESIAQSYQFVDSGNVELGFISASQLPPQKGSHWLVPQALYDPLEQQVVVMKSAQNSTAAMKFYDFLRREPARQIVVSFGYSVPLNQAVAP